MQKNNLIANIPYKVIRGLGSKLIGFSSFFIENQIIL